MTGDRPGAVFECSNCRRTTWHALVSSEAFDGSAYRCANCEILVESAQVTIPATTREGGDRS